MSFNSVLNELDAVDQHLIVAEYPNTHDGFSKKDFDAHLDKAIAAKDVLPKALKAVSLGDGSFRT